MEAIKLSLRRVGKGIIRLKENVHQSKEYLRMQVRRKMILLTRILM